MGNYPLPQATDTFTLSHPIETIHLEFKAVMVLPEIQGTNTKIQGTNLS